MKEQLIEALDKFLMEKPEEFAKLAAKGSISLGDNGQLEIDFDVYQQLLKK